jgi:hypothetical protein
MGNTEILSFVTAYSESNEIEGFGGVGNINHSIT